MKRRIVAAALAVSAISGLAWAADPMGPMGDMGGGSVGAHAGHADGSHHIDDMGAAPGAPIDYGYGPGVGKARSAALARAARAGAAGKARALGMAHVAGMVSPGGADAASAGYFDPPVTWPIIGLHAMLLPDGRLLSYGTDEAGVQGAALVYDVWDPSLGVGTDAHTVLPNTTATDIFCSFPSLILSTGEVLISGGDMTIDGTRNYSNNSTTIFSPSTNTIRSGPPMAYPRWYPSIVNMPNGDMVTLGGRLAPAHSAITPEAYNPASGWRTLGGATSQPAFGVASNWFYPKAFLAPAGNLFVVDQNGTMWNMSTAGAGAITRYRALTTRGAYQLPTIMYAPGKLLSLRGDASAETIDFSGAAPGAQPVITQTAPIDQMRYWANATVMADGKVLVTGGSSVANKLVDVDLTARIWDPATGAWTAGASAAKARLYHSIALLLPDATVLTGAGGAPGPAKQLNAEIYYPPYLYLNDGSGQPAPRPSLSGAPASVAVGQTVSATVGAADVIGRVTLVRTGSVTHSTNIDQRFFDLPFTQTGAAVSAALPADANVLPPGDYMMFVFAGGVPSVASLILVTPS